MRHSIAAFIAIAVLFTSPAIGQAITVIDVPGSTITSPIGIDGNNIVGYYKDGTTERGFLYDGSTYTTIHVPGARSTYANDIQDSTIVGDWWDSAGDQHGFIFDGLNYTTLDVPEADWTTLRGIDGSNVVGGFSEGTINYHGFLYDGTSYATLDPPGSTQTQVQDTDEGKVTGYFVDGPGVRHGFIYDGVSFAIIDFSNRSPNYTHLFGTDGVRVVGDVIVEAFVYDGFVYTQLAVPGARSTFLYDIQGTTVVGEYTDLDSTTYAFVADISELVVLDADFNEDSDVDGNDFLAWQTGFGTDINATHMDGDANGDGDVEGDDFLAWQTQFGRIAGGSAGAFTSLAVPEPTAGAIATFILLSVFFSRCYPARVHHRVAEDEGLRQMSVAGYSLSGWAARSTRMISSSFRM